MDGHASPVRGPFREDGKKEVACAAMTRQVIPLPNYETYETQMSLRVLRRISAMQTEVTRIHPAFCLFIQVGSRRASTTDPEFKRVRQ